MCKVGLTGIGCKSSTNSWYQVPINFCTMRLTQAQQEVIRATCLAAFNADANIWLFGSRLDNTQRGGDVDLYVETGKHRLVDELRCKIRLEDQLQIPVDLIVRKPFDTSPIAIIAKHQGHRL